MILPTLLAIQKNQALSIKEKSISSSINRSGRTSEKRLIALTKISYNTVKSSGVFVCYLCP